MAFSSVTAMISLVSSKVNMFLFLTNKVNNAIMKNHS